MITIKTEFGTISLDTTDSNEYKRLAYAGDRAEELRDRLSRETGYYGHLIGCSASAFEVVGGLEKAEIDFEIEGNMGIEKIPSNNGEDGIIF